MFIELANTLRRLSCWKRPAELRDEIDQEIRFHLEERATELEAKGLPGEAARIKAEELFGDVDRMALDCFTIQMGERIMLQRIQWGLIGVLGLGLLFMGWSRAATIQKSRTAMNQLHAQTAELEDRLRESEGRAAEQRIDTPPTAAQKVAEAETPEQVTARYRARFLESPDFWRHGLKTVKDLLEELSAEEAVRVLREVWPDLSDAHKQQTLKAIALEYGHPGMLPILHLGATS